MKITVFILILLGLTQFIYAQQKIVSGKVVDTLSGEPLQGALIKDCITGALTMTDKSGNFILHHSAGDTIIISDMCYATQKIKAVANYMMNIRLNRSTIMLKDITIRNGPRLDAYRALTSFDLNMQPVKSAQDLLRLVPGLFIAQHMGGGKAEQIFLRGFDADHGTDVNITVDGLPVNMVTHAHGQGYADMHFLIPETVGSYDFGKGPYYTDKGDFTTAGFVSYSTKTLIDRDMIKVEYGQFHTYRIVTLMNLLSGRARENGQSAYIAGEGLFSDGGPFKLPEHFTRYNLFGKFNTKLGSQSRLTAIASTFRSDWKASGELPDRSLSEGYVFSRFGVIDSAQGGHTKRTNASIKVTTELGNNWNMENQVWYSHYYFNLVSNFTYYYYFPQTGDEFRQLEHRDLGGYNGKITKTLTVNDHSWTTTIGINAREDDISPIETDHTENGRFLNYLQFGKAKELGVNAYWDETLQMGKWLFNAGVRMDNFNFSYANLLQDTSNVNSVSGKNASANKAVVSPKLNIEYTFNDRIQLFLKSGKGLHSNDARVVVANRGFEDLPAAYGLDFGINWKPFPCLYINSALWYLYLQQEFTFGQDLSDQVEGAVKPSGKTSRVGIDFSVRYQFTSWLFANMNVNLARPRYLDSLKGHDFVPLAPTLTSTAGLDFRLKSGINGGISYRYLHDRAANSDYSLTARGYFITDLALNLTRKSYEFGLSVENLFNRTWDESQVEYISRLKNERMPVDQVSYTPGVPLFAKLKFSVFF
jgi:hypothetical protein